MTVQVDRITIKKDGIYISSRESKKESFKSTKNDYLTKIFFNDGQKALDIAFIQSCFEGVELVGTHYSILRYKDALEKATDIKKEFNDTKNKMSKFLTPIDKASLNMPSYKQTEKAKQYVILCDRLDNQFFNLVCNTMDINPQTHIFDLIEVNGVKMLYTSHKIPKYLVSKSLFKYELQYCPEDGSFDLITIHANKDFGGTVLSKYPIEFNNSEKCIKFVKLKDQPRFCDIEINLTKYRKDY